MDRLTSDKDVKDMGMVELAYNSCYAKDGKARYRDYDIDIDARQLAIELLERYADIPNEFTCDDDFDDRIIDYMSYGMENPEGLIALFYRNLWAMADLRERLKRYEDAVYDNGVIGLWGGRIMREYNPNIAYGIHTVKVTLQQWEYTGHIIWRVGGNCKGKSVLNFDFEDFEDGFDLENDCEIECDDGLLSCILHDGEGNELEIEGEWEEMNELIVGMEVIDFVPESEVRHGQDD